MISPRTEEVIVSDSIDSTELGLEHQIAETIKRPFRQRH